jgi:hypothetical protein
MVVACVAVYLGGPWDGGFGPLEPDQLISKRIDLRGGSYLLDRIEDWHSPRCTRRAIYTWSV